MQVDSGQLCSRLRLTLQQEQESAPSWQKGRSGGTPQKERPVASTRRTWSKSLVREEVSSLLGFTQPVHYLVFLHKQQYTGGKEGICYRETRVIAGIERAERGSQMAGSWLPAPSVQEVSGGLWELSKDAVLSLTPPQLLDAMCSFVQGNYLEPFAILWICVMCLKAICIKFGSDLCNLWGIFPLDVLLPLCRTA